MHVYLQLEYPQLTASKLEFSISYTASTTLGTERRLAFTKVSYPNIPAICL